MTAPTAASRELDGMRAHCVLPRVGCRAAGDLASLAATAIRRRREEQPGARHARQQRVNRRAPDASAGRGLLPRMRKPACSARGTARKRRRRRNVVWSAPPVRCARPGKCRRRLAPQYPVGPALPTECEAARGAGAGADLQAPSPSDGLAARGARISTTRQVDGLARI